MKFDHRRGSRPDQAGRAPYSKRDSGMSGTKQTAMGQRRSCPWAGDTRAANYINSASVDDQQFDPAASGLQVLAPAVSKRVRWRPTSAGASHASTSPGSPRHVTKKASMLWTTAESDTGVGRVDTACTASSLASSVASFSLVVSLHSSVSPPVPRPYCPRLAVLVPRGTGWQAAWK